MDQLVSIFKETDRLLVTFKIEPRLVRPLPLKANVPSKSHYTYTPELLTCEHISLEELPVALPQANMILTQAYRKVLDGNDLCVHATFNWIYCFDPQVLPGDPHLKKVTQLFNQLCAMRKYTFRVYRGRHPRNLRFYCN